MYLVAGHVLGRPLLPPYLCYQAMEECTSLDEMHRCRAKYLRAVTRYCLLRCSACFLGCKARACSSAVEAAGGEGPALQPVTTCLSALHTRRTSDVPSCACLCGECSIPTARKPPLR